MSTDKGNKCLAWGIIFALPYDAQTKEEIILWYISQLPVDNMVDLHELISSYNQTYNDWSKSL